MVTRGNSFRFLFFRLFFSPLFLAVPTRAFFSFCLLHVIYFFRVFRVGGAEAGGGGVRMRRKEDKIQIYCTA